MSMAPIMIVCPECHGKGDVIRYMPLNQCQYAFKIRDICDRCGGSGKVVY